MNQYKSIHQLSKQLGITSRTLRYWEEKGLLRSERDMNSGWRYYSEETESLVKLIVLFRELDIPLKDIKFILDSRDFEVTETILRRQMNKLDKENTSILKLKDLVVKCMNTIKKMKKTMTWIEDVENTLSLQIFEKENLQRQWEDIIMVNDTVLSGVLRIVNLPAMRLAVCNIISDAPEDEALDKILEWAEKENIMGTARIFGFNTTEYKPGDESYGWAASITVPENTVIPDEFEEKVIKGGLYASVNSTSEVYDSWQLLTRLLKENKKFKYDEERTCLEEHIANGEPINSGNAFYLNLMSPVIKANE